MMKIKLYLLVLCLLFSPGMAYVSMAGTPSWISHSDDTDVSVLSSTRLLLASANDNMNDADDDMDEDFLADDENGPVTPSIADPLYYFNYAMYGFNDFLYFVILKPVAVSYKTVTPEFMRIGVRNFFHNLLFPVRFVNNLLQGEIHDAGTEIGVFLMNSTAGVLGLAQVAQSQFDVHTNDEDLGQTLGTYAIGNGFYVVWPFFGPSTLRDSIGMVGDSFLKPLSYVEPIEWSLGMTLFDTVNSTTFRIGDYEALKDAALDPYVAIREAYIEHRKEKVAD